MEKKTLKQRKMERLAAIFTPSGLSFSRGGPGCAAWVSIAPAQRPSVAPGA